MRNKIVISLLLIVLLPVGFLAWLGLRMAHNEQQVLEVQVQALVRAQLTAVDDSILAYFQGLQNDLIDTASQLDQGGESLKKFARESSQVTQVLVIGADGKRVFPAANAALSDVEKQFLQRTSAIWENPGILTQGAAIAPSAQIASAFSATRRKIESNSGSTPAAAYASVEAGQPKFGWYAWHWNAQLHHMFWWRDAQNRVIGFELAPVAVLSEIISRLPATSDDPALANTTIRLVNSSGQPVYEWGRYQLQANEKSLAMLPLSHPLASWKLEYFAPGFNAGAAVNTLSILAVVLVVGLALAGLATYLYREHSREVRVAQQRVNFVNQVSHELKTPLTNIRLYAELLETELGGAPEHESTQDNSKAHKYIGIITSESQRLSRLIANVLSFGQFQKTQYRLCLQVAKIDDVILRCIAAFKPALDAKAIAMQFDAHADRLVMLDPQALEQILNNLISNVEKYAASGGAIHISSSQTVASSVIDVRDFGPGVAARDRNRIFQPFYRVSSLLTDGVAGTGIGLDIARQLARLHGGDVSMQDVASGACFRVTLRTLTAEESA